MEKIQVSASQTSIIVDNDAKDSDHLTHQMTTINPF